MSTELPIDQPPRAPQRKFTVRTEAVPKALQVEQARRVEHKTVIVTGAARGIGLATALRVAQEGGQVVIADLRADQAKTAARAGRNGGAEAVLVLACDVSDEQQVRACVQRVVLLRHAGCGE